jgi:hypothetical protein
MPERVVVFRLRSIFAWLGVLLAVVAAVGRHGIRYSRTREAAIG